MAHYTRVADSAADGGAKAKYHEIWRYSLFLIVILCA
jgi:hypothetical protein